MALVNDSDIAVRRAAAAVTGEYKEASARSLLEGIVLSDKDPAVRRNAAWALGRIGDSASRDVLLEAAKDASSLVRNTAKVAVQQLR